jgi:hypothetical protein
MTQKISRDDLEAGIRQLQGDAKQKLTDKKRPLIATVGVAAAVVVLLAFLLGKRSGKKRSALIEIRRL